MAVSVDTVYQRVLAILNKEQRGYVTPQEFNLFANQAQLDIFEQYFYDINQYGRVPGNDTAFSDMLNILNEKINLFETNAAMTYNASFYWQTPANLYRLGTIVYANTVTSKSLYPTPNTVVNTTTLVEAERINYNEYLMINQSEYLKPTNSRPVFVASTDGYKVYGAAGELITGVTCNYIKNPAEAVWGYQIVYGEALYDATTSVDFELHDSEETELVVKILEFAGLVVKDIQMYQIADGMEMQTVQQEKQ
jgi:hypothetical protein|tara:strand:- start:498 stop:1250 length:753 start_codon:yes stop_codon:yes gene_type:complete